MYRLFLFLAIVLPSLVNAQSLKSLRKESYQTLVFKIDASAAEKYIKKNSIDIDAFSEQVPFCTFNTETPNADSLPIGHYVLLTIKDSLIKAELANSTQLWAYPINNQKRVQIEVRDKDGKFVSDAKVILNNRVCKFNKTANNYIVSNRRPDNAFVKIYALNDTTFLNLTEDDDRYNEKSIARQKWTAFKRTKLGNGILWLPNHVITVFSQKQSYKPPKRAGTHGLMLFSQPKYKLNDTVRLKAYLYDKKNKIYKRTVGLYLEYWKPGKGYVSQKLTDLNPTANGSFIYEFVLRDSLANDMDYNVVLKKEDKTHLLQNSFRIEEYVLDEVAAYSLRTEKTDYYKDDSLIFYGNAKDANGLNLLDGTARLLLTTRNIDNFFNDRVQIPDTLFTEEKKLETQGDTRFAISSHILPEANLVINVTLIFRNSNNEIQERNESVNYKFHNKKVIARQVADTVYAITSIDGKPTPAKGKMETRGEIKKTAGIEFPYKIKIDPFVTAYLFDWMEKDSVIESDSVEIGQGYHITLSRLSIKDTLGFILHNPYKIPVNYSVFKNNLLVATGKDDRVLIEWKRIIPNKQQMYTVKYQYIWAGEEVTYSENIGLLYKLLDVKVNEASYVFPGQKDSIEISVKDYKNNPAAAVNLTAFSYNGQFKEKRSVPDPPYLQSYKFKSQLLYKKYEKENPYFICNYSLGKHGSFIRKFGIDSMLYYQILFPADSVKDVATRIVDYLPQVSVHVVEKGVPQQVYVLYLNNQLVYYYNATGTMPYAFNLMHGYAKIGIRLFNKYVEIDSIYVQPFYKHDIVFDLNKLPVKAKVIRQENYLSDNEKNILENNLFQIDYDRTITNSFLWQGNKVVDLSGIKNQIVSPFVPYDSIHFFGPARFDLHFIFEPTYRYRFSDKIIRLEKNSIFPGKEKYYLEPVSHFALMLGDTIIPPPVIAYPRVTVNVIKVDDNEINQKNKAKPCGALQLTFKKDTAFSYMILESLSGSNRIVKYFSKRLENIPAGNYRLFLVMNDLSTVIADSINILHYYTLCQHVNQLNFTIRNEFVEKIANENKYTPVEEHNWKDNEDNIWKGDNHAETYPAGSGNIKGIIVDAKGQLPITSATVTIKGRKGGAISLTDGSFIIKNIKPGNYTIIIYGIGYEPKEIKVDVPNDGTADVKVLLSITNQFLNDVVVVGYGAVKRKELTGAVSALSVSSPLFDNIEKSLQGKLAGVSVTSGITGNDTKIFIRGLTSLNNSNMPVYVIDGIIYNEIPKNLSPDMIESMEISKDESMIAKYGAAAVNGVIIITTKIKSVRESFRDYAFWQPELISDENGKIKFSVTYPDNITSWQTYVLAMDKKLRIGKVSNIVQAYKPVMAQLSVPQFLVEGDSVVLVGKSLNYTNNPYQINTRWMINSVEKSQGTNQLQPHASLISAVSYTTTGTDSVKAFFSLKTTTGFKDGEERKIPVYRRGVEENTGEFRILNNDTTIGFSAGNQHESLELSADNKTLDVLLKEIDHLKQYPFYCMEQTASKLRGVLMEKVIRRELNQPFKDEKIITQLLNKLQKTQLFDGGWAWWENGKANFYITNYIINALLALRTNPLVEVSIRNGLLYLQNELDRINDNSLLTALNTMAAAGHSMDYVPYLKKINFDSLSLHQQWQWIYIQQKIKGNYQLQLKQLVDRHRATILGGIYWGNENYLWYSNSVATTVLAYGILKNETAYSNLLPGIMQYFLEMRQNGYWRNTVESAEILSAVLPDVLAANKEFTQPGSLKISGDTSFTVTHFPFMASMSKTIKNITVQKSGGGMTYLSVYQKWFNKTPAAVNDKFEIRSYFKKNNETRQYLTSGEKVKMMVEVTVKKDAEFVMLQIPIPAGCTYASKNQDQWNMHKEFFKDRVVMFAEKLAIGKYTYEIELEPRYNGKYILNPSKVELMYFPVFYGRNEMKTVDINAF